MAINGVTWGNRGTLPGIAMVAYLEHCPGAKAAQVAAFNAHYIDFDAGRIMW